MQVRNLSSGQTILGKFVIPVIIILSFYLSELSIELKMQADPPEYMSVLFPVLMMAIMCFWLWGYFGIKRVRVDDKGLYVSDYFQEITVPFNNIKDVRQIDRDPRLVRIYFFKATEFGDNIMFLPKKLRFLEIWCYKTNPHPVIAELKQLAGISR